MVVVVEVERMGWVQSTLPYRYFWSTDCRLGVGNVVASMLNLSEGVTDVFEDKGKWLWKAEQSSHDSHELQFLLHACLSLDPSRRPEFPELLKTTQEHRVTLQADLRDKPGSDAWDDYELIREVTNMVCIRRLRRRSPRMN